MSVASKLLGTPSHEDLSAVRQQAQVRASEDAARIRELERQLRDKEGESNDRGRALAQARQQVADLARQVDRTEKAGLEREWQMEQLRERSRQMLKLAQAAIQPVQSDAKAPTAQPVETGAAVTVPVGADIRSLPRNALLGAEEQDR